MRVCTIISQPQLYMRVQQYTVAEKGQVKKKIRDWFIISKFRLIMSIQFGDNKSKLRDNKSKFRDNERSGFVITRPLSATVTCTTSMHKYWQNLRITIRGCSASSVLSALNIHIITGVEANVLLCLAPCWAHIMPRPYFFNHAYISMLSTLVLSLNGWPHLSCKFDYFPRLRPSSVYSTKYYWSSSEFSLL